MRFRAVLAYVTHVHFQVNGKPRASLKRCKRKRAELHFKSPDPKDICEMSPNSSDTAF